jgi:hypothetical protein
MILRLIRPEKNVNDFIFGSSMTGPFSQAGSDNHKKPKDRIPPGTSRNNS